MIHIHAFCPCTIQPVSSLYITSPFLIAFLSSSYCFPRCFAADFKRFATSDLAMESPYPAWRTFEILPIELWQENRKIIVIINVLIPYSVNGREAGSFAMTAFLHVPHHCLSERIIILIISGFMTISSSIFCCVVKTRERGRSQFPQVLANTRLRFKER